MTTWYKCEVQIVKVFMVEVPEDKVLEKMDMDAEDYVWKEVQCALSMDDLNCMDQSEISEVTDPQRLDAEKRHATDVLNYIEGLHE